VRHFSESVTQLVHWVGLPLLACVQLLACVLLHLAVLLHCVVLPVLTEGGTWHRQRVLVPAQSKLQLAEQTQNHARQTEAGRARLKD